LGQSADIVMAHTDASGDADEVLAQSVARLAISADADGLITRSGAHRTIASADPAINDAIERLTEQLAAFCFEKLERRVDSSAGDWDNDVDMNREGATFENELLVRIAIKGYSRF
jgi:hypothetical protein